jgi:hypothetical protein
MEAGMVVSFTQKVAVKMTFNIAVIISTQLWSAFC